MAMKALNIKLEEDVYEKLRAYSFVQKKPMTSIIREYISLGLDKEKNLFKEKISQILELDDEVFANAMKNSLNKFDDVYKKLAQ